MLEPGRAIQREITGGDVHVYEVKLSKGQYAHISAYQRGVDLVVVLIGPDGKKLAEIDTDIGSWGPEEVVVIAETTGDHLVELRPEEKKALVGRYEPHSMNRGWLRLET